MHKQLFREPRALETADLLGHAVALGLDEEAFSECLKDSETAERVRADVKEGQRLGVSSTPVFFLGVRGSDGDIALLKRINGAVPFDAFKQAVADISSDLDTMDHGVRRGL